MSPALKIYYIILSHHVLSMYIYKLCILLKPHALLCCVLSVYFIYFILSQDY